MLSQKSCDIKTTTFKCGDANYFILMLIVNYSDITIRLILRFPFLNLLI